MRIEASPGDAIYDEPIRIRLSGFPPLRAVTVRASAVDGLGRRWASTATFLTDASGEVDLTREAPRSGAYRTADATGLLW
ncbi:MAG: acyl-CoA thioesterase/BAAT N-terminal domain-containing protein [Candidatus Binataceae bacterium]